MNSPKQYQGTQRLAQSSSPYFQISLYAAGNVLAVAILLLVWFSSGILAAFQEPLLWAWLCSLSLRDVKRFLVSTARRELQTSSFLSCCAKLVFLPAVIAWQLFEEVRDKLQAKYHELQISNQASTCQQQSAAAAVAADLQSGAAADSSSNQATGGGSVTDAVSNGHPSTPLNGHAGVLDAAVAGDGSAAAGSLQAVGQKGSAQVLRQRKSSGKQQQHQQQQRHQRPPLGPRANSAAARVMAGQAAATPAAGKAGGTRHAPSKKQQAASQQQQQVPASPLRQRLLRLQDFFRHLFSGYGFITMELLRFILGGLLPRRSDPEQQQRQQQQQARQQQQQQQQLWPASSSNSTMSTLASLQPHQLQSLVPPYLDLHVNGTMGVGMRVGSTGMSGLGDSCAGTCRSECNMPWTPHPHLHQMVLQQQQQGFMPLHLHKQQQQHQQPRGRLSSSSSSPSLHTAAAAATTASRQPSPRATRGSSSGGGVDGLLERHMTVPAAVGASGPHSFSGWAGPAAQGQVQQQQQQQQGLSRSDSTASCAASHGPGAAAAVAAAVSAGAFATVQVPDSLAATAAGQPFQHPQQQPSPAAAFSLPSPVGPTLGPLPLPSPALSLGGCLASAATVDLLSMQGAGGGYEGTNSLQSGCWEGMAGAKTPTGSVTGATGGGSSPSAVLFKGLLRGIVLYEGYRFVQGFLAAEQSLFMPLLMLGATLAVAGGLPFLLLPVSLLKAPNNSTTAGPQQQDCEDAGSPTTATAPVQPSGAKQGGGGSFSRRRICSPFSDAQQPGAKHQHSTAATAVPSAIPDPSLHNSKAVGASGGGIYSAVSCSLQRQCAVVWSRLVSVLVRADAGLRNACASSFLDTAVSGLIVVGLILGSVVLSAVLLVQIGDESRQAVVSLNTLVRQKGTEAGLTEGVWSLVQQYEGQLVGMTQYVLQETLPGLTHYVENRASDFLISHNLSKVLVDWEVVRAALKLPADCGDEAKLRLAVQLANSSLAEVQLGQQRQQLQQQLDAQQQQLGVLAGQLEAAWINGSSSRSGSAAGGTGAATGSSGSSVLAQDVLRVQAEVERLQEELHSAVVGHEAASEQLKLAELRMHACQPAGSTRPAGVAAGLAGAAQGRGLLSNLLGGFTTASTSAGAAATGAGTRTGVVARDGGVRGVDYAGMSNPLSHVRGALAAVARFDFATAGSEVAAVLGQLMHEEDSHAQQQQEDEQHSAEQARERALLRQQEQEQLQDSCGVAGGSGSQQGIWKQHVEGSTHRDGQCPTNHTCQAVDSTLPEALTSTDSSNAVLPVVKAGRKGAVTTAAAAGAKKGGKGSSAAAGGSTAGSSGSSASTSLVRVARGAAYPLITLLRHVSSVLVAGLGSTTAVALGTGLGVLRLGLGVAKFLVQLGVFASVLYTLLALDIDPVEQLVKLLPISDASQDRASRAVTKALRGVFVSSLKLAGWHAGFTWLTLRAFGTHFVCTATVASAIVAVLPFIPVYLTALPAVLELVLVRGAAVKGLVLLGLHVGAYTFGDDLIYREIEPTLPYLVGLGVFGGMWHFANPLQGVLLGPMVLALLSVGYNLHREMY